MLRKMQAWMRAYAASRVPRATDRPTAKLRWAFGSKIGAEPLCPTSQAGTIRPSWLNSEHERLCQQADIAIVSLYLTL